VNRADFLKLSLFLLLGGFTKANAKSKNIVATLPHIKKFSIDESSITLEFSKDIDKKYIKSFEINDKRRDIYKKIFDIKSILDSKATSKKHSFLKKIKIAQFQKNTTRVVLENNQEINTNYQIEDRVMTISLTDIKPINIHQTRIKTVVIDAGHGGKDSGAISKNKKEKDAVLKIALELKKELKKSGYKVHLTRDRDRFIELRDRTKIANLKKADIFISVHANAIAKKYANKYKGIETYFLSPAKSDKAKNVAALENQSIQDLSFFTKETFLSVLNHKRIIASNKLAIDTQKHILSSLKKNYKVTDGGVREAPFWVLVGAQMPSILIESGYISNPTERKRLFNSHYQKLLAKGISNGINSYFLKN